jgi:transcriptional regulator with XRE-family HTH domain
MEFERMLEPLSELRKERKWSLQETADQLGIAKSTYAGYESGYREPSLQSLSQIADLFETTVDYILGRTGEKQGPIDISALMTAHDSSLLIDGVPLTSEELMEFVAFVRMKRLVKTEKRRDESPTEEKK